MLLLRSLAFTITLVPIRTVVVVVVVVVTTNFLPVAERNKLLILLAVPAVLAVILLVLPAVLAVILLVLLVLLVLLTSQSCHIEQFRITGNEHQEIVLQIRCFISGQSISETFLF